MTKEKSRRIVHRAIKSAMAEGWDLERSVDAAMSKLEIAIELEQEENDQGVYDMRPLGPKRPDPDKIVSTLPPPPKDSPSLIITPDQYNDKDPVPVTAPIKLSKSPESGGQAALRKYWKEEHLRDYIDSNTSESISIMASGRDKPVELSRNIEILYGVNLVKLIYSINDAAHPTASSANPSGEILSAIAIDTPVFATFSCYDKNQDIDAKMDTIVAQAEVVFAIRPKEISSVTPRRTGHLGFGADDPHDDVGKIINPVNGKVW